MKIGFLSAAMIILASPAVAQRAQPNIMTIAQVLDRCMTTQAVRLSRESTDDEAIFSQAKAQCAELDAALDASMEREVPAERQADLKAQLANSEKPNFMTVLAKIRSDRSARASQ